MKVQLQGQSLRLRIGEDELARFLAGETVVNATAGSGAILRQSLRMIPGGGADGRADAVAGLAAAGGEWSFSLPEAAVRGYVARLPCRDALEFRLGAGDAALELSFEVDVRDSVRRRGPPQRRRTPKPD